MPHDTGHQIVTKLCLPTREYDTSSQASGLLSSRAEQKKRSEQGSSPWAKIQRNMGIWRRIKEK